MPLFQLSDNNLTAVAQDDFVDERTLQRLIEKNLKVVYNSRFIATEFRTGQVHAGRIDTLALSTRDSAVSVPARISNGSAASHTAPIEGFKMG